jgi:hypothetical protein
LRARRGGPVRLRQNHLAHGADPRFLEEHVLGAAQTDALAAEFDGGAGVVGRVGIDADAELAEGIRPAHQRAEFPDMAGSIIGIRPAST